MNQCKYLKKIDDDNNYKKNLKGSMMIIVTSKIFNKIDDDNNYIKNIQRDRWQYLDRKYLKGSVRILRSKIFKGIGGNN